MPFIFQVEKRIMRTGDGTHYILGTDEAISSVTAIGPLHPMNPTYTTKFKAARDFVTDDCDKVTSP